MHSLCVGGIRAGKLWPWRRCNIIYLTHESWIHVYGIVTEVAMTQERAPIVASLRFRRLMMLSKESLFLTLIAWLSELSRPRRRFGREHALLVGKTVII